MDPYQFLSLEVSETHFRFRGLAHAGHSYLYYMRKKHPELKERKFSLIDSASGLIIVRVQ